MQHPKLDMRAPRFIMLRPLVWLIWSLLLCALLALSAWAFARHIPVTQSQHHIGQFESTAEVSPVVLPAGVSLAAMMVAEGAEVTQGQKLARFDQPRLRAAISETEAELARNTRHRACLLLGEGTLRSPTEPNRTPPLEDLRTEALQAECLNLHHRHRLKQERLMHRRDSLRRESALAVEELLMRAKATQEPVRQILKLRAALERETLENLIRDLEFALASLQEDHHEIILQEVQQLESRADLLEQRLQTLTSQNESPWLRAPQNGQLVRLRDLTGSEPRNLDLVLAQVLQSGETRYEAHVDLPRAQAELLPIGTTLSMQLAGLPPAQRQLEGQVIDRSEAVAQTPGSMRLTLRFATTELPPMTQEALASLPAGTRSTLTVALPPQRLSDILRTVAAPIFTAF
ncbi:biotin/lipoyl-binding protein [Shimia sp. R11_0]|uniref:biotin/lipoyl-binding protein n=1 Tax=Shimia sp. R11_0 TaxID=2821096 RepID=UPI001ADB4021|nr:biotin/lipoyl-binding protein [Shimia sp. R11_0]MBO9478208.1 biotin/lipoyl-binding protein [Shimia sp. R11_0]